MTALLANELNLRYASDRLRDRKGVVLQAVTENGRAIEFSSERLWDEEEVVRQAVQQVMWAFQYASPRLHNSPLLVALALEGDDTSWRDRYVFWNQCCSRMHERLTALSKGLAERGGERRLQDLLAGNGLGRGRPVRLLRDGSLLRTRTLNSMFHARHWAETWIRGQWERVWLVERYLNSMKGIHLGPEIRRRVVEFTGFHVSGCFSFHEELRDCEALINALIQVHLVPC